MPDKMIKLVEKLRMKYPSQLKEEPLLDEMIDMSYDEEPMEEDMEEMPMEKEGMEIELEVEPLEGDEDMLENYEEEDVDMLANSNLMKGEEENKKSDHKRRMALRKALKGL